MAKKETELNEDAADAVLANHMTGVFKTDGFEALVDMTQTSLQSSTVHEQI